MRRLLGKFSKVPHYDGESLYIAGFKLQPLGDCCASCYIQHVSGTEALYDATIVAVETIASSPEMQAQDSHNDGVSESWGHRITTTKGICSIEMRVEHNGWYGGSLECNPREVLPASAEPLDDF